jgi:O-antigen/teichoic acid export membrane protein
MNAPAMSIERRMARSAAWMVGLRLAERSIGLVSTLVLARLLVPADFGLVAMGTVVLGALEAMTAFGFELALIKRQAKDRARWDSAWTLNALIGIANASLIAALAPAAAAFYGEPRIVHVMLVLAAAALVSGLRNIGMVEFEQDLRFRPIVLLALARRLGSVAVTLALAWWHGTYWALLAGIVAGQLVDVILSYVVSPYRPRPGLAAWRDLFSFSKWLLVNNLLGFASQRGGDLIVGGRSGAAAVGLYSVSFELANLPTSEMVRPVMRAVFPGYAMMSSDPARLAQGFITVFSLVLLFALPAAAGIALLAEPLVSVLLGPRWAAAVPLLQVLAIYGGIRAAQANTGSVYMALDRPQLAAAMTLLNVLLAFGSFAIALGRMPLADAAWFMVAGAGVAAVVNLSVLNRSLDQPWRTVLAALRRPALAIAAMTAALIPLRAWLWTGAQPIHERAAVLLCLVLAGAAVYLAALLAAWHAQGRPAGSPEDAALALVRGLVGGRTS